MDRWSGKVAVVTGASSGIGAAIVEELAKAGVQVVALARRLKNLEKLSEKLIRTKGKVYPKQCDVKNEGEIVEALKWVETELGGVDILINNAGVSKYKKIIDDDAESIRSIFDVNVVAMAIAIKAAVASIKKRKVPGYIININSITGHFIPPVNFSMSVYPASKYAVTALTETVRNELSTDPDNNIRITSISPGFVKTEIFEASGVPNHDKFDSFIACLDPVDIANAVLYVLGTPETVLVSELTIRPSRENLSIL